MTDANKLTDGLAGSHALSCSPSSETPECEALWEGGWNHTRLWELSQKLERERNQEMGYRSQWCDKARKLECKLNAALDALDQIESHYVDGDDTYEAWEAMGEIAATFLAENV